MKISDALSYDDVLLVPQYSEIESRSQVDLSIDVGKSFKFSNPIIPSNMKTVAGYDMVETIYKMGGLALVHRFMSLEEQLDMAKNLVVKNANSAHDPMDHVGFSVGVKEADRDNIHQFVEAGVKIICIDVAHGDTKVCVEMCEWISRTYPQLLLIAGNVATGEGAARLWAAGADAIRVGIGPGSICSTRIQTGNGVPQLTALMNVAEVKEKRQWSSKRMTIIADGGIKNSGDCVKSLCFADMVMAGNIFAGADETPGDKIMIHGKEYKEYVGSSTHKTNYIEGVAGLVPTKGKTEDIFRRLLEGVRSGLSYQGCSNLTELKENPQFVRMTGAGLKESYPHDIMLQTKA